MTQTSNCRLAGKTAVITGGAADIGRAFDRVARDVASPAGAADTDHLAHVAAGDLTAARSQSVRPG